MSTPATNGMAEGEVRRIVTGALATFAWSQWTMVVLLLAIAVGAVVPTPWAPAVVLLVAALAVGVTRGHGALWGDTVWSTGLTVLLAGLVTHAFTRLSVTIAELQAAREELARSAVSHERLRFARDLHDLLGHSLSLIVVKAEATRRIAPADAGAAARHAADIETIGRQALDEVRSAVRGYRDAGLSEELAGARDTLGAAGVTVELPEHRVPTTAEQEALLGWVVREGTTNVLRHARARRCTITLDGDEERLRLRIVDDGVGHAAGHDVLPGSGLTGLRERLVAAGGQLETVGSPTGFSLTASLPRSDYGRTERICP
jgi:two-component system sensor histidine kinase DesK